MEKIDLTGLEFCPTCGHKLKKRKTKTEKAKAASLANLAKRTSKGGRPKGSKNKPKPEA
ncbi:MAG: hypothetical protein V8T90_15585 [Victivallales bacterium]